MTNKLTAEDFAAERKDVADFKQFDGMDSSTRRCPCGAVFTWSGHDPQLDVWMAQHRPHLTDAHSATVGVGHAGNSQSTAVYAGGGGGAGGDSYGSGRGGNGGGGGSVHFLGTPNEHGGGGGGGIGMPRFVAVESSGPAPELFPGADADTADVLRYFAYEHLPPHLQDVSAPFALVARDIVAKLPPCRERTKALDRLLEAKDCAVRAKLHGAGR